MLKTLRMLHNLYKLSFENGLIIYGLIFIKIINFNKKILRFQKELLYISGNTRFLFKFFFTKYWLQE